MLRAQKPGFTLMELILVIGIIAVLSAVVIAAINPLEQFEKAKQRERAAEAQALQDALMQSVVKGEDYQDAPEVATSAIDICRSTATGSVCTTTYGGYDLSVLAPSYIGDIPVDSTHTGSIFTGYRFYKNGSYYFVCSRRGDEPCGP